MQFLPKCTSPLCSSSMAFAGDYWGWILYSNGSLLYNICKDCALPLGPTGLIQEQMNVAVQPISSTNVSAQQTRLWKHSYDIPTQHLKHPIQPAINCHFRHLWQTVNTCLSENNCTLWAQPMEQHFLSNQWLIREPNKNKGYTIWSPPFYLCSIKTYDFN